MFLISAALSAAVALAEPPAPAPTAEEAAPASLPSPDIILLGQRFTLDLGAPVRQISFSGEQLNRLTYGDQPAGILNLVPGIRTSRMGTTIGGTPLRESAVMLDGVVILTDGLLAP